MKGLKDKIVLVTGGAKGLGKAMTTRFLQEGATVVIADNGIGIREEDQARVFEKGYTGYNGRADKKSTGIGLYLCRQVMDRLNHGISLTSRPGQGTLVRLDLSREWRMVE